MSLPTREVAFTAARGFCMGAADVVPGVSGGTVALVFGIYHRLVAAIQTGSLALGRFAKLDFTGGTAKLREVEWLFLIPLLGGIGMAVASLAHLIETLLAERPVEMAGLFLGLVVGSVLVAWELLTVRDAFRLVVGAVTAVVVFGLLGLQEGTSEEAVSQVADPALWAFVGAGALAICAMILPGISGSFILVMLGMYGPVLGAVTDRDLVTVAVFATGCVLGLALFSQVLHWALNEHYDTVMAALIGLMLGSTRVLWPWPAGVDSTALEAPSDPVLIPVLLALGGVTAVAGVNEIAKRLEGRTTADEVDELRST